MWISRLINLIRTPCRNALEKRADRRRGFKLVFAASDLEPMRRIVVKVFGDAAPTR